MVSHLDIMKVIFIDEVLLLWNFTIQMYHKSRKLEVEDVFVFAFIRYKEVRLGHILSLILFLVEEKRTPLKELRLLDVVQSGGLLLKWEILRMEGDSWKSFEVAWRSESVQSASYDVS